MSEMDVIGSVIFGIAGIVSILIGITEFDFFYEYEPRKRICDYADRDVARLIDIIIGGVLIAIVLGGIFLW